MPTDNRLDILATSMMIKAQGKYIKMCVLFSLAMNMMYLYSSIIKAFVETNDTA